MEALSHVVRHYWQADTMGEKLRWVRRPSAVGQKMLERYGAKIPKRSLSRIYVLGQHSQEGFRGWIVEAVDTSEERQTLLLEDFADGRFRVDWETEVGFNENSWREFLAAPASEDQEFRVRVSLADYYNFAFEDAGEFLCLLLECPGHEDHVYGYLKRGQEAERSILDLLNGKLQVPMILKLRKSAHNQATVVGLSSRSWLRL